MTAIFWLSGIPGDTLTRDTDPLIRQAPKIIAQPIGKKPKEISWMKVGHFVGYAALGAALLYGFERTTRQPGTRAMATAALYAVSDEIHQAFVPNRSAGWQDVALDASAAGLAILLLVLAQRLKKKRLSKNIF